MGVGLVQHVRQSRHFSRVSAGMSACLANNLLRSIAGGNILWRRETVFVIFCFTPSSLFCFLFEALDFWRFFSFFTHQDLSFSLSHSARFHGPTTVSILLTRIHPICPSIKSTISYLSLHPCVNDC